MQMTVTGKNGALTTYKIVGDRAKASEIVKAITTYSIYETADGIEGSGSKSDINKIREAVEAQNIKPSRPEKNSAISGQPRYLTLLSAAESNGLNHGKSWVCGEKEIETMGASPEWEGMQVCYVYA